MATVVKDFKVKSGLIVEGTTAKVNNFDILTKKPADQNYIIGLIGGSATPNATPSTVVLRDANADFSANVVTADLVGDVTGTVSDISNHYTDDLDEGLDNLYFTDARALTATALAYDEVGSASDAQDAAQAFATQADTAIYSQVTTDIATAKSEAGVIAQGYADDAESDAIAAAALDATSKANAAQTAAEATASADATSKANAAQAAAEATASADATSKANAAQSAAVSTAAADATTKANAAQTAAEEFATQAIADLVDGSPETLDTLNELALALQDNPDVITNLQNVAAGKQDTLTAGGNIDITGSTISVTGLDSGDISDFNSAANDATALTYDLVGAAASAQSAAQGFATAADLVLSGDLTTAIATAKSEAINTASGDATSKANTAQSNAEGFATAADTTLYGTVTGDIATAKSEAIAHADALDTDDIEEGATKLYFTDARAKDSAGDLLANAITTNVDISYVGGVLTVNAENGVADSDTDDLDEGENNLYFTDNRAILALQGTDPVFQTVSIDEVALQVASSLLASTAGVQTAYAWAHADYRSAEFLVKVAYGTHTEISKVLLTLDTSDNIAITEYGIVGTNGSASTVSAGISGDDVQLLVTTNNNTSTVTVVGTLLA